jgi:methyl-accepting chemotaxis protein
MSILLKPAISLSNSLRFKAKFLLLALMFYLPLLACFVWIVKEQVSLLSQYEKEITGYKQINQIVTLELDIAKSRVDSNKRNRIASDIKSVQSTFSEQQFRQTKAQLQKLTKTWQNEKKFKR